MKRLFSMIIYLVWINFLSGQELEQTVRGRVIDAQSQYPVVGATVLIVGTDPIKGAITDIEGYYLIHKVPIGKISLRFTFVGYEELLIPNVNVSLGKQSTINASLEESMTMMETVIIDGSSREYEELNELATLSVIGFNIAETERYAGSLGDPGRMAANYAGVSGVNDGRNDIIIRGNSPSGLLWRLEGVDVPNPNHYAGMGTSGGPVTILNNNQLANSEFYTGAFPAMFGNATSGVFDLKLRNGNFDRREYVIQTGFNGIEAGLEGPFKIGGRSSYTANYRYSIPAIMHKLGFGTGTGTAIPYYQDMSVKLNFPTNRGSFSIFSVGGLSHIDLLGSETDATKASDEIYNGIDTDIYNISNTGILGLSYLHFFDRDSYLRNSLTVSGNEFIADLDTITRDLNYEVISIDPYVLNDYKQWRISYSNEYNRKFNARSTLNSGFQVDWININLLQEIYRDYDDPGTIDQQGTTFLLKSYVAWSYRINENLTMNSGLNYMNLTLNRASQTLEPRIGFKYKLTDQSSVNVAYGKHSQMQALTVYFGESYLENGKIIKTNTDLGFTKSHHLIFGYEQFFGNNWKIKSETYYQMIFDVPVEKNKTGFSLLNAGADFGIPREDSLLNKGTGRNIGLELTVEKFLSNGWYTLLTSTLYDSRYEGSDRINRNTVFNGNFVFNLLGGKEIKIGKSKAISFDGRMAYAGNRRYVPIDPITSELKQEVNFFEQRAFENRLPDYFRLDIKIAYKMQKKRYSQEWQLDLQNITNRENIQGQNYSFLNHEVYETYQLGFWPMFKYRVLF